MGAQLLKEAATKTNDVAGDGTTTATVLAQAIVNEGLRTSPPAPTHAAQARHRQGVEAIVDEIKSSRQPVNSRERDRPRRRHLAPPTPRSAT